MNLFQAANGAATFLILSALVGGLAKNLDSVSGSPIGSLISRVTVLCLALFVVVFRIKTLLDDHKYFGEPSQDKNTYRYTGFLLAIISWIFWALAAYLLPTTTRASELMATGILVSTLWVAVHVLEILTDKERRHKKATTSILRVKWVLFNLGYMLLLTAHVGWFRPLIPAGTKTPLFLLLALLSLDIKMSDSFRGVIQSSPVP